MGGEPLLRPKYLARLSITRQRRTSASSADQRPLMKPDVIDRLGDAGLGSVNLAIDVIDEKPGWQRH